MTERRAPAVYNGLSNPPFSANAWAIPACSGQAAHFQGDAVTDRRVGQTHQPLTLAAVLRHVLTLDPQDAQAPADELAVRRLNRRLGAALDICLQLDTARQQLQHAIATQRELETVLEMLVARVDAGQAPQDERREVAALVNSERELVADALSEWNRIGRRFARHTHLLPTQLDAVVEPAGPIPADEMDRLAEACLWTHADVHVSLLQRAMAWSDRLSGPTREHGRAPEGFHAWIARMELARAQAAADFSAARETYLQGVLELDREHACLVRARSARRNAEAGFRSRFAGALAFVEAIVEESRRTRAVLALQAHRTVARSRLFALAGLLPAQFGLTVPTVRH